MQFLSFSSMETRSMSEVGLNICTFCVVDRLRLTIRITFSISSYIDVNLLYLIYEITFS